MSERMANNVLESSMNHVFDIERKRQIHDAIMESSSDELVRIIRTNPVAGNTFRLGISREKLKSDIFDDIIVAQHKHIQELERIIREQHENSPSYFPDLTSD